MATLAVILKNGENVLIKGRGGGGKGHRGNSQTGEQRSRHYCVTLQYLTNIRRFPSISFRLFLATERGNRKLDHGKITPDMHLTALSSEKRLFVNFCKGYAFDFPPRRLLSRLPIARYRVEAPADACKPRQIKRRGGIAGGNHAH